MEKLKSNLNITVDQKIYDEMYELYESNPKAVKYIASLNIPEQKIKDNIAKIYDFVCDLNYCAKCPGFIKCEKKNPHMAYKIVYEYDQVDRQLTPCKQLLKQIDLEKQFIAMDFDKALLSLGTKDIDCKDTAGRKTFINRGNNFITKDDRSWIYLTGIEGSGRSFLASFLSVQIAKKEKGPIAFLNTPVRFKELASLSMKDEVAFQRKINLLCTVPVLVLDDFGNEFKTEFERDAILLTILSKRAARKLFTVFTSDFPIEDVVTMYDTSRAAGVRAKQIGNLIASCAGEEINLGDFSLYK